MLDDNAISKMIKKAQRAALADSRPPIFSDEALALHFAEMHADDLRYVAAWNKWLSWDGTRWHSMTHWRPRTKRAKFAAPPPPNATTSSLPPHWHLQKPSPPSSTWRAPTGGSPRPSNNGIPTYGQLTRRTA